MARFSGWTRLDTRLLEAALSLGLLLAVAFGLLVPVLGVIGVLSGETGREVGIESRAEAPAESGNGLSLHGTDTAVLTVADPGFGDRLLLALPGLTSALFAVVGLALLLMVARTFRDGDIFVPANSRRLTAVAFTVLLAALLVPLAEAFTTRALVGTGPLADSVPFRMEFSGLWVLAAILVEAVAGAFRHGTRLRADTVGLV